MLQHIFRNLWNTRKRNAWIVLELVVITVVCWIVVDPLFVLLYNKSIPDGYEADGLYKIELSTIPSDSIPPVEEFYQLMSRLRSHTQIESATYVIGGMYPCAPSNSFNNITVDTASVRVAFMRFFPRTDFFKTWRMRSAKDKTWETLEEAQMLPFSMILTSDAATRLSPDEDLTGKTIYGRDSLPMKVVALMQPVKMKNCMQPYYLRLIPWTEPLPDWALDGGLQVFFRTKPNVSEQLFMEEFIPWMEDNLTVGNFFFSKVEPFHKVRERSDLKEGATSEMRIKYALCYFFLINLFLGVSGTFWLSTRTRREEMGVRLSYGASPRLIRRMLLGEASILTTISVAVGCLIYFQWALSEGFYEMKSMAPSDDSMYITNQFILHFFIVSGIVYGVMLVVTWIGVWIPARKCSKISPVSALKDE